METKVKTRKNFQAEIEELQRQLSEARETIEAIRHGAVDALLVDGSEGPQVYMLSGADQPYRVMVEEMQEGAVTLREDGVVMYCNEQIARMLRTSHQSLLGKSFRDFLSPHSLPAFEALLHNSRTQSSQCEVILSAADGVQVPALLASRPVSMAGSNLISMVITDLTEQKRQSEERYRLAVKATNDAIWDINLATGLVSWNEAYTTAYGRPSETGDSWQWWIDHIHPDDRDRTAGGLRAAIDGRESTWNCEYRFLRTDGAWAHICDRAYIMRNTSGKAYRVVGAMLDLTERKRSEEAIAAAMAAARQRAAEAVAAVEAVRRVSLFPEQNPNPVLRIARDGTILYANPVSGPLLTYWDLAAGGRFPKIGLGSLRKSSTPENPWNKKSSAPGGFLLHIRADREGGIRQYLREGHHRANRPRNNFSRPIRGSKR